MSEGAPAADGIKAPRITNTTTHHRSHTDTVCPVLYSSAISSRSQSLDENWFKNQLSDQDAKILEHSGKMVLLLEILKMAEDLNDKVYVFYLS